MNEEEFNKYTDRPEDARAEILNFEEIVLPGNLKTYLVERVSNLELDDVNYSNNANIAIAASITAQGRIEMSKFKHVPGLDLKYFDTDSIFTSTSPEKLNQLFPHIVHPNQIGKLKLEGIAKKAVFLAPKAYALLMEDGSLTVKIKGLSKEAIDRAINKGILTIESMAGLLSQGRTIGSIPIIHSRPGFS